MWGTCMLSDALPISVYQICMISVTQAQNMQVRTMDAYSHKHTGIVISASAVSVACFVQEQNMLVTVCTNLLDLHYSSAV